MKLGIAETVEREGSYVGLNIIVSSLFTDLENESEPVNVGGYSAVPFSYGNAGDMLEQKNANAESSFRPPFSVPENLLQNLVNICPSDRYSYWWFIVFHVINYNYLFDSYAVWSNGNSVRCICYSKAYMSKFQMLGAEMEVLVTKVAIRGLLVSF